ncbi:glucose-6-phosphate isomerase [Candidatus Saccharibacteria bacterium]|nr:glucose-6-phosphate isomerase [Candidatus Saccharibacteria bacterium]
MIEFRTENGGNINLDAASEAFLKVQRDEMAGWLEVPTKETDLEEIKRAAKKINSDSDFLVCIGIGGSYLGHKAVIDALEGAYTPSRTKILYAGNSLNSFALSKVLAEIGDKDFSVNVISKSGTTTEPAVAFRIFKEKLIEKYGSSEAHKRIYATTDGNSGALHDEAVANNYTRFIVPDNVGGRYSVLTPVGLLPIAVAGISIEDLIAGASGQSTDLEMAFLYATYRTTLAKHGFDTEILATFEPRLQTFSEWWKQLFGESEGKGGQGIFPASVVYSTDLHSLGQYMQDGRRNIFETFMRIAELSDKVKVPKTSSDIDGLGYLEGKSLDYIQEKALEATVDAHRAGGIPVFEFIIPELSAKNLGALIYIFEVACAVSATMQGVNPFDQPGVESYKKNMFSLLGKP